MVQHEQPVTGRRDPAGQQPAIGAPRLGPAGGADLRVTLICLWPRGGMLHYAAQLANALGAQPGVRVTAILPRDAEAGLFAPAVTRSFVDVVTGAALEQLLRAPGKLLKLPQFLRRVHATAPDLLHINSSHVWLALTLPYLRRRYPVVATVHDVQPHPGADDSWRKRLERKAVTRFADRLVVHRERLRGQLVATSGRPPSEVRLAARGHYGFLRDLAPEPAPAGMREPATVLFFGRIRAYKGLRYLLAAAPKVRDRIPGVRFVIAGEGDLRPYARQLRERSLFEVHNRFIPDREVAWHFRRAAAVALPYIEASDSGILGIAWSCGTAVVASAVGCLPDVIEHGRTGLLVPPRDSDALAAALIDLLERPQTRARLTGNGVAQIQAEDLWQRGARDLVEIYGELLAETRRPHRGRRAASRLPRRPGDRTA